MQIYSSPIIPLRPAPKFGRRPDSEELTQIRQYIADQFGTEEAAKADPNLILIQDRTKKHLKNKLLFLLLDVLPNARLLRQGVRKADIPEEGVWFYKIKRYESPDKAREATLGLREVIAREQQQPVSEKMRTNEEHMLLGTRNKFELVPEMSEDTVYAGAGDVLMRKKIRPLHP